MEANNNADSNNSSKGSQNESNELKRAKPHEARLHRIIKKRKALNLRYGPIYIPQSHLTKSAKVEVTASPPRPSQVQYAEASTSSTFRHTEVLTAQMVPQNTLITPEEIDSPGYTPIKMASPVHRPTLPSSERILPSSERARVTSPNTEIVHQQTTEQIVNSEVTTEQDTYYYYDKITNVITYHENGVTVTFKLLHAEGRTDTIVIPDTSSEENIRIFDSSSEENSPAPEEPSHMGDVILSETISDDSIYSVIPASHVSDVIPENIHILASSSEENSPSPEEPSYMDDMILSETIADESIHSVMTASHVSDVIPENIHILASSSEENSPSPEEPSYMDDMILSETIADESIHSVMTASHVSDVVPETIHILASSSEENIPAPEKPSHMSDVTLSETVADNSIQSVMSAQSQNSFIMNSEEQTMPNQKLSSVVNNEQLGNTPTYNINSEKQQSSTTEMFSSTSAQAVLQGLRSYRRKKENTPAKITRRREAVLDDSPNFEIITSSHQIEAPSTKSSRNTPVESVETDNTPAEPTIGIQITEQDQQREKNMQEVLQNYYGQRQQYWQQQQQQQQKLLQEQYMRQEHQQQQQQQTFLQQYTQRKHLQQQYTQQQYWQQQYRQQQFSLQQYTQQQNQQHFLQQQYTQQEHLQQQNTQQEHLQQQYRQQQNQQTQYWRHAQFRP